MAQTERDMPAVFSQLPDNLTGQISPQDVRDAVASAMGYAGLLLTIAGAPDNIVSVSTTPILVDIFDQITAQSIDVNLSGSAAALSPTYDITFGADGVYQLQFFASFSLNLNNRLVKFTPHIDGSPGTVEVDRFVATGADTGVVAMNAIIPMTAGQKLDMRVNIDSGSATLTFLAAALNMFRVG
jgi:hypothetical protein